MSPAPQVDNTNIGPLPPISRNPYTSSSFLGGTQFENGKQKSLWIATYTSMLLWMLMLLILYMVAGSRKRQPATMTSARPVEGRPMTEVTTVEVYEKQNTMADRFRRAVRAARLNFILIFSATVITALGYGPTGGTVAMTWVAFAVGCLWVLAELFTDSHWLRLICSLIIFPLVAIIYGLAFRSRID
ncbi:hypothetical protein BCR44DRAFT_28961 [Catenaria anguillulae PL171]|uniref:Uncharacterized protein n=1 Tax=Catenaria anguillulae PL171 TaxID=765915 RepID=A0A1Y2HQW7_9FUNG|nr:hypothetical protein BCR44DRAFT_28961 [Catenaria anguillulae PL171]